MLAGCGKEESAEVRAAEFPGTDQPESGNAEREEPESGNAGSEPEDTEPAGNAAKIWVYVCGQVADPGVYELTAGDRIVNALAAAGGMTEQAAVMYLNQAKVLEDGQKIYVPSEKEVQEQAVPLDGGMGGREPGSSTEGSPEDGQTADRQEKVNLNTAGKAELMTLSGIGESRAEAIISYREKNGRFRSIEEIKKIEGIKEGIFGKIKDKITV